jgi:pyochelin synthetase
MNMQHKIAQGLTAIGERIALSSGGQSWTGLELLTAVARFAAALEERGAGSGRPLLWRGGDDAGVLPLRLAAMWMGCRWMNTPPLGHADEIQLSITRLSEFTAPSSGCMRPPSDAFAWVRGAHTWTAAAIERSLGAILEKLDPPPRFTAVLGALDGWGGDVALASLALGVPVQHHPACAAPARALALLERGAFECVASSAALLRGILQQPALAWTEVRLRRFVYDADEGGALSPAERCAAADALRADVVGFEARVSGLSCVMEHSAEEVQQTAQAIAEAVSRHPLAGQCVAVPAASGWGVFAVPGAATGTLPAGEEMARWVSRVEAEAGAELASTDLRRATAVNDRLGRTALLSMLNALRRCGAFDMPACSEDDLLDRVHVAAPHRALVRRWIRVLTERGLLFHGGGALRPALEADAYSDSALARAWDEVEVEWSAVTGAALTIEYARRNAECLPDLIRGHVNAVHLLFPEGRTDFASALYRESTVARYQQSVVRGLLGQIAEGWSETRPLRVLEVGGGTGATSEALLPVLEGHDVDYLFTDVSRYFLDQAPARLGKYPFVRYDLYDIDMAPRQRGLPCNAFDVIIAGGVLNAARDTEFSLRGLLALASPGGWLILTEPTLEEYWVMASQAFMLKAANDARAETESTFLSLAQWNAVLDAAGWQRVLELPQPGHPLEPLGHRVFAARAKLGRARLTAAHIREQLDRELPGARGAADIRHLEVVDALPLMVGGEIDRRRLQEWATGAPSSVATLSIQRRTPR